jgi:hypothetical protein
MSWVTRETRPVPPASARGRGAYGGTREGRIITAKALPREVRTTLAAG